MSFAFDVVKVEQVKSLTNLGQKYIVTLSLIQWSSDSGPPLIVSADFHRRYLQFSTTQCSKQIDSKYIIVESTFRCLSVSIRR